MLTFLFWNTNKQKKALEIIFELAWDYEVDILMLAESIFEPQEILTKLNDRKTLYSFSKGECKRIQIFTRFSHTFVKPLSEGEKYAIRHISRPAREDLILVVAHLSSKMYAKESDQMLDCSNLADEVRR
ncbi:MAG: hypothetical protein JNN15_09405, partial [Blastocatellia bacterium]|nr:hypothetical protein [Blastocatellia bacterium]